MADDGRRRRIAPLRAEALLGGNEISLVARGEPVGVDPVLVHAAPRVLPVIEYLAAEDVATDAPDVLVLAVGPQVMVAEHQVIEAMHLERKMVQADLVAFEAEECMVIDVFCAAVAAVEARDDV